MIADLPQSLARQILERLPEEIREEVVERLYSFASIREQSSRNIQKLISTINRRTLATALIGAETAIREVIARNMSRRAATMLEEDVESLIKAGELSTRDVREAREAVSRALFELHESGEIGR
jgi:flagellar motor switch protein FliG